MTESFVHICTDTATKLRYRLPRRKTFFRFLLISALYLLFFLYPGWRIATACFPSWEPGWFMYLLFLALPFLGRWWHRAQPGGVSRWGWRGVMAWLGLSFIALIVLVPAEILALLLPISEPIWGFSVLSIILGLGLYASLNAQRISIREVEVHAFKPNLEQRICQISDVHVGSRDPGYLRRVVGRVNTLAPDAVMITGDLIDMRAISHTELQSLADLRAPVFFCTGNHERYVDLEDIDQRLRSLGVRVLRNTSEVFADMQIIGIDDAESPQQVAEILPNIALDPDKYTILLYHRPHGLEDAAEAGIDLMLSGHTHNGQIVPFNWLVKRFFPHIQGRYSGGKRTTLYVSPGTGTWGPVMRLGSRNEITLLRIVSA